MDETTNGMTGETTEPPTGAAGAGNDQSGKSGKEELKAALANLTSALNKFGAAADAKAREEWKQAKPEIQKALAEMKRAVEAGTQKASSSIDNLSKKMDRNKTTDTGDQAQSESNPNNPSGWGDGTPSN
jgi:ElaB/YqjD/DUF883 family membrane-anchored ribosome-binding protein